MRDFRKRAVPGMASAVDSVDRCTMSHYYVPSLCEQDDRESLKVLCRALRVHAVYRVQVASGTSAAYLTMNHRELDRSEVMHRLLERHRSAPVAARRGPPAGRDRAHGAASVPGL